MLDPGVERAQREEAGTLSAATVATAKLYGVGADTEATASAFPDATRGRAAIVSLVVTEALLAMLP